MGPSIKQATDPGDKPSATIVKDRGKQLTSSEQNMQTLDHLMARPMRACVSAWQEE